MTARTPAPPDLSRLPCPVLQRLITEAARLPPVPTGPLPVLDGWMIVGRAPDLLHARGYLDGGAERLRLPLLAVVPERPAVWLLRASWVTLGAHELGEDGEELAALLLGGQRWCDALPRELRRAQ